MTELKHLESLLHEIMSDLAGHSGENDFRELRERAQGCLEALLGSDHYYTQSFQEFVEDHDKHDLLAAAGILSAVYLQKHQPRKHCREH